MVFLSHTLAKPTKVTGHVNLGSSRRDCAPWEVTGSILHSHIAHDAPKWWAHTFSARDCQSLDFSHSTMTSAIGSAGEGSRRLHKCHQHPPLLGDDHWHGSQRPGSSAVSHSWSPLHPKAASECRKCCSNPRWFWDTININLAVFQHAFRDPCIWAEFEINIV